MQITEKPKSIESTLRLAPNEFTGSTLHIILFTIKYKNLFTIFGVFLSQSAFFNAYNLTTNFRFLLITL